LCASGSGSSHAQSLLAMTTVVARAMKTPDRHTCCGKKEQQVRRSPCGVAIATSTLRSCCTPRCSRNPDARSGFRANAPCGTPRVHGVLGTPWCRSRLLACQAVASCEGWSTIALESSLFELRPHKSGDGVRRNRLSPPSSTGLVHHSLLTNIALPSAVSQARLATLVRRRCIPTGSFRHIPQAGKRHADLSRHSAQHDGGGRDSSVWPPAT